MRLPRVTGKGVVRALERAGWAQTQAGSGSSHRQLIHPSRAGKGTVAIHAGEIVSPQTLKRILEQAGMAVDELREVL